MRKVQENKNWVWKIVVIVLLIFLGVLVFGDFTPDAQMMTKDVTGLLSK